MRTIYKPLFRSLLTDFENSIVAIVVFQSCILIKKNDYCIKIVSNNDMYKDILKSTVISLISFSLVFSLLFCLVGIDQRLKRHKIIIIVSFLHYLFPILLT